MAEGSAANVVVPTEPKDINESGKVTDCSSIMAEGSAANAVVPTEPKDINRSGKVTDCSSIMAEGIAINVEVLSKPKDDKDPLGQYDLEDISSLELLFTRDLITYVMRRRIPCWEFDGRYGGPSPVTPFCFRIRNAVEHYLIKEDIDIYFLFSKGFSVLPLNYGGFVHAANFLVGSVYPNINSPNDLLRLLAMFAQYTVLAYKKGIHMAPYYSLVGIQDLLYLYIDKKKLNSNKFFANLGLHAESLVRETPLVPYELLL